MSKIISLFLLGLLWLSAVPWVYLLIAGFSVIPVVTEIFVLLIVSWLVWKKPSKIWNWVILALICLSVGSFLYMVSGVAQSLSTYSQNVVICQGKSNLLSGKSFKTNEFHDTGIRDRGGRGYYYLDFDDEMFHWDYADVGTGGEYELENDCDVKAWLDEDEYEVFRYDPTEERIKWDGIWYERVVPSFLPSSLEMLDDGELLIPSKMMQCKEDSDCTMVLNHCGYCTCGAAINVTYEQAFNEAWHELCTNYDGTNDEICEMDCGPEGRIKYVCESGQCKLKRAKSHYDLGF